MYWKKLWLIFMQPSSLLEKPSLTRKKHSVYGVSWPTGTSVISHLIRIMWRTYYSSFTDCMRWYVELCSLFVFSFSHDIICFHICYICRVYSLLIASILFFSGLSFSRCKACVLVTFFKVRNNNNKQIRMSNVIGITWMITVCCYTFSYWCLL